jgi:hypothetical protein
MTWIGEHRVVLALWLLAAAIFFAPGLNYFWPR